MTPRQSRLEAAARDMRERYARQTELPQTARPRYYWNQTAWYWFDKVLETLQEIDLQDQWEAKHPIRTI